MENYHQGDLTDIIRATATPTCSSPSSDHQFPPPPDLSSSCMNFSSLMEDPRSIIHGFGDPYSTMRDPFLHDLDFSPPPYSFHHNSSAFPPPPSNSSLVSAQHHLLDQVHHDVALTVTTCTTNNAVFSNMIQISPRPHNAKLPVSPPCDPSPAAPVVNNIGARDCLVDIAAGVQISSPRNPGLKRRKSQAKKVVCIPAPAAANSRPSSGEVVPSDLWAWRKYGQKPIKGSPYPRGYYRCSSSKGCSARKQVERSRTDPNMLVITYTSEHNHPWPTQRNALAGSTRSQPSTKTNPTSSKNNISSEASTPQAQNGMSSSKPNQDSDIIMSKIVKEEMEDTDLQKHDDLDHLELELENNIMEDDHSINNNTGEYKPSMVECNNQSDQDFFAELGEIEVDPLNLLFTQDFNEHHHRESKALDPFHLFDWSGSDHHTNTSSSFQEPKRRL